VDDKFSWNVLKNFEMIFLDLLFTSMLQGKNKFEDVKSMDPKILAIILFHLFVRETVFSFFLQRVSFSFIHCSPKFYHFSKTQTRPRLNCMNKT